MTHQGWKRLIRWHTPAVPVLWKSKKRLQIWAQLGQLETLLQNFKRREAGDTAQCRGLWFAPQHCQEGKKKKKKPVWTGDVAQWLRLPKLYEALGLTPKHCQKRKKKRNQTCLCTWSLWLTSLIPAIQKAEARALQVWGEPEQLSETPCLNKK